MTDEPTDLYDDEGFRIIPPPPTTGPCPSCGKPVEDHNAEGVGCMGLATIVDLRAALARSEAEVELRCAERDEALHRATFNAELADQRFVETSKAEARAAALRDALGTCRTVFRVADEGGDGISGWAVTELLATANAALDSTDESVMAALRAADAAFRHDNTTTGTCPDCADQDAPCDRAMELWPVAYAAFAALRERGVLIAPTPDPEDTAP